MFRKFLEYLNDSNRDISERIFGLLSFGALCGILMAFGAGILIKESLNAIVLIGCGFLIFSTIIISGYRLKNQKMAASITSFLVIFIFLPAIFFNTGGIHGGTPIWCVFAIVYVTMIVQGRTKIFFCVSVAAVLGFCWHFQYLHPETVVPHPHHTVFLATAEALLIVSFVLSTLVWFQSTMFRKESEQSRLQKQEIEKLINAQNSFFSSMSHEIRTPINTIIGLNEIILREQTSDEIREDAESIRAAGNILLHLVNDILDVSRMKAGRMTLTEEEYDTARLVTEITGMFKATARDKGLIFNVDVSTRIPARLIGDDVRIRQIVINLLNNAFKYTSEGEVDFSVQFRRQSHGTGILTMAVSDTGMGIKKESLPHLFDEFTRADEDKNRYIEGTGLGLSIVKHLLDLMNGKITVNSIYTKGSTFVVEIPQGMSGEELIGQTVSLPEYESEQMTAGNLRAPGAKILIVDDTESNILVVTKLLKESRIEIDTASSGMIALEKTATKHYDVILMDHMMPRMDGIETMHAIRHQVGGYSADSTIVCLTARADRENEKYYAREGFDGYLTKPVNGRSLEEMLFKLLPEGIAVLPEPSGIISDSGISWLRGETTKTNVFITTESVADIPGEFLKEYIIPRIPYSIKTSDGVFADDREIFAGGVAEHMRAGGKVEVIPPDEEAFQKFFADALVKATNVIHISAYGNKRAAGGYATATEASKAFDNVSVINSMNISCGMGMMTVYACRLADSGLEAERVIERVKTFGRRINSMYYIGRKGLPPGMHRVAKIKMEKLRNVIALGNQRQAKKLCVADIGIISPTNDKDMIFLAYCNDDDGYIEQLSEYCIKQGGYKDVYKVQSSAAITALTGPESVGVSCTIGEAYIK